MDIDIILEADVSPQQMKELAVEAERLGVRALWSSNYHQNWDGFLALAPAAAATSKILLGPLAVSPWEMHPLKMANAVLTLNELLTMHLGPNDVLLTLSVDFDDRLSSAEVERAMGSALERIEAGDRDVGDARRPGRAHGNARRAA